MGSTGGNPHNSCSAWSHRERLHNSLEDRSVDPRRQLIKMLPNRGIMGREMGSTGMER